MSDRTYRYRGEGCVGNPGPDVVDDVELAVRTDDDGATLRIRSRQFPGGEIELTEAQLDHLRRVLDDERAEPDHDIGNDAVIDADGTAGGDAWRPL